MISERPPDSIQIELLRAVEYGIRRLEWRKTEDGAHGRNAPEPMRLPWDPEPEGTWRGDSLDWEEAAEALGGDPRLARLMAVA